ncbi:MAG TPA: hypothetical protein VN618_05800 [Solirubrobacteraceae bacterium]|nr:hypothetical protein [Solirubrobacteraceae bacterium]
MLRGLLRVLPVALVAALVATSVAAGVRSAKPKPIGAVVAVGGSKKLSGNGVRLGKGARLRLGEHLVMGAGLSATLRLTKPAGAGENDLVDLSPAKGAKLDVKVSRSGATITVAISPV